MKVKLAEALLRRKELQGKVDILKVIKEKDLFEVKGRRQKVTDDLDDVIAQVPLLEANQVTHEYDWHARQLRLVDAAIQQANWTCELEIDSAMGEYPGGPARLPRGDGAVKADAAIAMGEPPRRPMS